MQAKPVSSVDVAHANGVKCNVSPAFRCCRTRPRPFLKPSLSLSLPPYTHTQTVKCLSKWHTRLPEPYDSRGHRQELYDSRRCGIPASHSLHQCASLLNSINRSLFALTSNPSLKSSAKSAPPMCTGIGGEFRHAELQCQLRRCDVLRRRRC